MLKGETETKEKLILLKTPLISSAETKRLFRPLLGRCIFHILIVISAHKVIWLCEPMRKNNVFLSYSGIFLQCYAQNIVSGQKGNVPYI